jgi:flagellar hook-associated protein 1 FlgK
VSNSDTTYNSAGYTGSGYNIQVGNGVKYSECRHIRDQFLDTTYREENGRMSFYDVSYSAILEIEDIMGEFDAAAFKDSLSGLWSAMEEISKSPNDTVNISTFVQQATSFMENAGAVYDSFKEYQDNLNIQIKDAISEINAIGDRISELNERISKIEVGGIEHANDLRDERDNLLDTLSGYGNISYSEDSAGVVTVRFNNSDFVTASKVYEMRTLTDEDTGFVTPYWPQNVVYKLDNNGIKVPDYTSAYVFSQSEDISTENSTDVGSLRALLLARGDHVANYTDLDTSICTDMKLDKLDITEKQYSETKGLTYYNKYIANSVMMNVEAEFDNLVHSIATKINDVLAENCDPKSGYLCNEDGSPIQMFQKSGQESYDKVILTKAQAQELTEQGAKLYQVYDEDGEEVLNTYWKFIEEDPNVAFSLYNCNNLQINQTLVKTPAILGFKKEDESVDYNIGTKFIEAFSEEGIYLNPASTEMTSYQNCYSDLVNQVANSGSIFKGLYEFEQLAIEQAENERQTVIGVSSDEELEHMIMYQNAYNAASRYINVVNDMLDTLLSVGA